MGAYSNPSFVSRLRRLLTGQDSDRVSDRSASIVSRKRPKQAQVRLSHDQVAELIASYQAGRTLEEVAAEFGIYVRTAAAHLEREGVPQRRRRLTPDQVTEAVQLYESGWSTIQIAKHLGIYAQSVRYQLVKEGVQLRPRPGRKS
jgi:DNA-directed RNA polymerase specialized sigma24 family protein